MFDFTKEDSYEQYNELYLLEDLEAGGSLDKFEIGKSYKVINDVTAFDFYVTDKGIDEDGDPYVGGLVQDPVLHLMVKITRGITDSEGNISKKTLIDTIHDEDANIEPGDLVQFFHVYDNDFSDPIVHLNIEGESFDDSQGLFIAEPDYDYDEDEDPVAYSLNTYSSSMTKNELDEYADKILGAKDDDECNCEHDHDGDEEEEEEDNEEEENLLFKDYKLVGFTQKTVFYNDFMTFLRKINVWL